MASRRDWTEEEVVLALALYEITPSRKICGSNPTFIDLAQLIGRSCGAVSRKLSNLLSLDSSKSNKGLSNCSKTDRKVFNTYWNSEIGGIDLEALSERVLQICANNDSLREAPKFLHIEPSTPNTEEDVFLLTKQRKKQNFFRTAVLANCNESCVISHCKLSCLLEAAHILPWSEAEKYRLSVTNGIALNPLLHKAYDLDLLGITPDGKVVFSESIKSSEDFYIESLKKFDGRFIDFSKLNVPINRDFLSCRYDRFLKAQ